MKTKIDFTLSIREIQLDKASAQRIQLKSIKFREVKVLMPWNSSNKAKEFLNERKILQVIMTLYFFFVSRLRHFCVNKTIEIAGGVRVYVFLDNGIKNYNYFAPYQ